MNLIGCFFFYVCGIGQKSVQRKFVLVLGEIYRDEIFGLSIRLDCVGEIDRNYN